MEEIQENMKKRSRSLLWLRLDEENKAGVFALNKAQLRT